MPDDDFDFNEDALDMSEDDLKRLDREFLKSNEEALADATTDDDNAAYNFWFLVILLVVTVFFLAVAAILIVKGRQRRYELVRVGYR